MEENYLPIEIKQEILMGMTLEEILDRRKLSKEWKEAVDNLWCRLLKRDYDIKTNEKCYNKYKRKYDAIRKLSIPFKKIEDVAKIYGIPFDYLCSLLELLGFKPRDIEKGSFFYGLDIEKDLFPIFYNWLSDVGPLLESYMSLGMPVNNIAEKGANEHLKKLFPKHDIVKMTINAFKDIFPKVLPIINYKDINKNMYTDYYYVTTSYKDYIDLYNTLNNNTFDIDFRNAFRKRKKDHPLTEDKALELIHKLANVDNITQNYLNKLTREYF